MLSISRGWREADLCLADQGRLIDAVDAEARDLNILAERADEAFRRLFPFAHPAESVQHAEWRFPRPKKRLRRCHEHAELRSSGNFRWHRSYDRLTIIATFT